MNATRGVDDGESRLVMVGGSGGEVGGGVRARREVHLSQENLSGPARAFRVVAVKTGFYTAAESWPPLRRYTPDTNTKIVLDFNWSQSTYPIDFHNSAQNLVHRFHNSA